MLTNQATALVLDRVRDAGPSWGRVEGPAAAGGAALVAKQVRGCGVTGAVGNLPVLNSKQYIK